MSNSPTVQKSKSPTVQKSGRSPKVKLCGMRDTDNILALATLPVDIIGLIFYPESRRYAGDLDPASLESLPPEIKKAGVFVDETVACIVETSRRYGLQIVQMHGKESPDHCARIKDAGYSVIKAFGVDSVGDFAQTAGYDSVCDYFLFDAKTPMYGGSGRGYNWSILDEYRGRTPFFLSGGISPDHCRRIAELRHPQFYAIDLNSRFETAPGVKNIALVKSFLDQLI